MAGAEQVLSLILQAGPPNLLVLAYAKRARTLERRDHPVPVWRQLCFAAGIALILAAELTPIGRLSEELLSVHMVQHMMIGDLAALLIALGLTGPLLQPLLAARGMRQLRWLAYPLVAVPLWVLVFYAWHLPVLYQAALDSDAVHALEHVMMLGAGLVAWVGLLGPLPRPAWFGSLAGLGYVIAIRLAGAALANFFMWSSTPFYPTYERIAASRGIDPVADQSVAGVVWALEGFVVTFGLFAWVFLRWAASDSERQELVDFAELHGVPLQPSRAARAVAAGRGGWLRRRLEDGIEREGRCSGDQRVVESEPGEGAGDERGQHRDRPTHDGRVGW